MYTVLFFFFFVSVITNRASAEGIFECGLYLFRLRGGNGGVIGGRAVKIFPRYINWPFDERFPQCRQHCLDRRNACARVSVWRCSSD